MSEKWRNIYVLVMVIGMVLLGMTIGLGKVLKESSYGLDIILLGLANALNNLTKEPPKP